MAGIETSKGAIPPLTSHDELNRTLWVPEILRANNVTFNTVSAVLFTDGIVTWTGGVISGLPTPTIGSQAVNKDYVDGLVMGGISWKNPVNVTTSANIVLSGVQVIDGILLSAGDRVLVKDQAIPIENGIYEVSAGAWTRASDLPSGSSASAFMVVTSNGVANKNKQYICTNVPGSDTVGTDPLTITEFSGSGGIPGGADTQIQFNNAGSFDGSSDLTWNGTQLTVGQPLVVTDTTNSTSASTGSVIVDGGVGIAQDVFCDGEITALQFNAVSDATLKYEIDSIHEPLGLLSRIDPVQYKFHKGYDYNDDQNAIHYGVLAQDLQDQGLGSIVNVKGKHLTVNYNDLVGILLASVQELNLKVERMKKKLKI